MLWEALRQMGAILSIALRVDHRQKFAEVRVSGTVMLHDILGYFESLVAQGAMPYAKLVDAREAKPKFSESDMETIGDGVRALGLFDPRGPVATVASSSETLDFLRRFAKVDSAKRPIENFATVTAAKTWLAKQQAQPAGQIADRVDVTTCFPIKRQAR